LSELVNILEDIKKKIPVSGSEAINLHLMKKGLSKDIIFEKLEKFILDIDTAFHVGSHGSDSGVEIDVRDDDINKEIFTVTISWN